MTPIRIFLPEDCSPNDAEVRAWRAAIDKANVDLARKKGWKLNVNFTEMTFVPCVYVPEHRNVVPLRRPLDLFRPNSDGPCAA